MSRIDVEKGSCDSILFCGEMCPFYFWFYNNSIINTFNSQALRLSGSAKKATTVGEILNLMSVDAQKLQVRHHQGLRE